MLDQYDVSRESLREALRLLEVQGLVAIRRGPGGGPTVCTVDPANLGRVSTLYYHLAGATYRELWEAWILAESILAERAAANPDDDGAGRRDGALPRRRRRRRHDERSVARARSHRLPRRGGLAGAEPGARDRPADDGPDRQSPLRDHRRSPAAPIDDPRRPSASSLASSSPVTPSQARALMDAHTRRMADIAGNNLGTLSDDFIEWQ